jgi:hypothetical protein
MKTIFTLDNTSISVSHELCSSFGTPANDIVLLIAEHCTPNTLSRIEVDHDQTRSVIYVHWEEHTASERVNLLVDEATRTLFVGAGTITATINLQTQQVVSQHTVDLFWHFERRGRFVVEFGELDCFLYDQHGTLVAEVPVDPPYEYIDYPDGIRFESINYGTQWLNFPSEPHS